MQHVLAIDQGTTGTRAILYNEKLVQCCDSYYEHKQYLLNSDWSEQDPLEIFSNTCTAMNDVLNYARKMNINSADIKCCGLANQGETVIAWNKTTGDPLHRAIVWHCQRTSPMADEIKKDAELCEYIRINTGLIVNAYFCATKWRWLFDNIPAVQNAARNDELCLGTLDSWLIWKLTGGEKFVTDRATASRTMLFNIHDLDWDDKLLKYFDIQRELLPVVLPNCADYGSTLPELFGGTSLPITGAAVDQQGALFGQGCFDSGSLKITYGTGCFLLMNTGDAPVISDDGLLTTIAWSIDGKTQYALDGGIYMAGAALQWLRDRIGLVSSYAEIDEKAASLQDNEGVYFVPAFVGLAAPRWDQTARGLIIGITMGTTRAHILRATLESIAYQVRELVDIMETATKHKITNIKVDGGISKSGFLMQFQSDILGRELCISRDFEATARGVAMMAGLYAGIWDSVDEIGLQKNQGIYFIPEMTKETAEKKIKEWGNAISRAVHWTDI